MAKGKTGNLAMRYYVLIPVYNEELNIETLHSNLTNVLKDRDVLYVFVDDCSTDGSVGLLKKVFSGQNTHVIEKEENKGPGDSFDKGFRWILENASDEDDRIITLEADNTSDLGILSNMLAISDLGYEMVLSSIYAQGGGFKQTNFFRKISSFAANMVFRSLFNINVLTLSSFYRVYRLSVIKRVDDLYNEIISESGFISMLELLLKAIRADASVIEVPMVLRSKNRIGKSKMKVFKTAMSYLRFLILKGFRIVHWKKK
ncbi:MAG: hypothetical protein C0594_00360 [Marinilabiliales bacterium]|nr:MAG: hypothetical protein C0594_00360 [Marinilabiliales bacterium]